MGGTRQTMLARLCEGQESGQYLPRLYTGTSDTKT